MQDKSELHVTNIERHNKGAWVEISCLRGMTLREWVIEALNRAAHDQAIDLDRLDRGYYD